MAIGYVNDPRSGAAGLGSSLAEGLSGLAEYKLNELKQQQAIQQQGSLYEKLGLPRQLASLPQNIQQAYVSDFMKNQRIAQEGQNLAQFFNRGNSNAPGSPVSNEMPGIGVNTQGPRAPLDVGGIYNAAPSLAPKVLPALQAQESAAEQARHHRFLEEQKTEELGLKRQEAEDRKYQSIVQNNKPYTDSVYANRPVAEERLEIAQRMKELLETGKVESGFVASRLKPFEALSAETQEFENLGSRLALLHPTKGQLTNFKLKLIREDTKPSIKQKTPVQMSNVDEIIRNSQNVLNETSAFDQLLADNDNKQVPNMASKVKKIAHKNLRKPENQALSEALAEVSATPNMDPSLFDPNTVIEVRNVKLKPMGNEWVKA